MIFKYIFWFFISIQLFSQKNKEDKLQNFIANQSLVKNIDKQISYLDSIKVNCKNLDTLFFCNYSLGEIYYKKKKFNLAKQKYYESLEIAERLKHNNLGLVYLHLGNLFQKTAKNDSAILYYGKVLKLSIAIHDTIQLSKAYNNIARVYFKEKKYKNAIAFYKKAIYFGEKSNKDLCTTYNNFGSLYLELQKNDSAIYYYDKSLSIAIKNKNKKKELRARINLAINYLDNPSNFDKAYESLLKSEKIAKELKAFRYLYYIYFHLGEYFDLTNQPKQAIKYYNLALNSESAKIDYRKQIEVLEFLAKFYEKNNNYIEANKYLKEYYNLRDSIFSVEKNKAFNEIRTKYEVAEKDNKINLLTKEKELERSKRRAILITAFAVLLLLLTVLYFLRNKIKTQKVLQQKEQELFAQELKTKEAHSLIEGQEKERNRLAKELHDGLGGQLAGVKSLLQTITIDNLEKKQNTIEGHLTNSIKNLRNISHDLSANFLKNNKFDELIHQMANEVFINRDINIELSIFPPNKINELPENYRLNIYRILQESFQNIVKHSKANFVSISIIMDNDINILIEDDGIGFDSEKKPKGIGLQNIKDRLKSLQGSIIIDSKINRGTTLNILIPLKND